MAHQDPKVQKYLEEIQLFQDSIEMLLSDGRPLEDSELNAEYDDYARLLKRSFLETGSDAIRDAHLAFDHKLPPGMKKSM